MLRLVGSSPTAATINLGKRNVNMTPLDSSFLEGFDFELSEPDDEFGTLTVYFKNGKEYVYEEVPWELVRDFKNSDSAGKFYSANIKGKFVEG